MSNEPSYPLHWPMGWPRSKSYSRSKFGERQSGDVSMTKALDMLEGELIRLGAQHIVISTNVQTRLDGRPYAGQSRAADPGAAVYFTFKSRRTVLACDKWDRTTSNLWAIAKHIEALRGQQRWGVGSVEQAFAGYAALAYRTAPSCWETLGIAPTSTEEEILKAWHGKAMACHPDRPGGSHEQMAEVNQAKDIALATVRSRRTSPL